MENNEITNEIMNEELQEVTEKVMESKSPIGLIAVAGVGLAVLVGGVAYKYLVKPTLDKRKTKKMDASNEETEQMCSEDNFEEIENEKIEDENEENEK